MFDDEWKLRPKDQLVNEREEYFIDRDPDCFSVLLNLLGTGGLDVPSNVPEKLLYREAHYYGLLDHVRTAKWGKFDSNLLSLTSTVTGRAPGNCTAIRASPDGGCAVAHGGVVHVYDWMLQEHSSLNLEYQTVSDIGWIDSENIVMSVSQSREVGGMGVFSSSTGELRHRFYPSDQAKGFASGSLCFNSDNKVFASCKETSKEGIGVWDQVTGKQMDFLDFYFGTAEKIQWLNESNCLFVNSCINFKRRIDLLDFRDKSVVRSWHDVTKLYSGFHVYDAIPMGESNTICVFNEFGTLGFIDFRGGKVSVRRNLNGGEKIINRNYVKLALHGGQLFCAMGDKISVYHHGLGQWVLTSNLERSQGGFIRDFSVAGDRLFALHSEKNVFDVWETPSAPII